MKKNIAIEKYRKNLSEQIKELSFGEKKKLLKNLNQFTLICLNRGKGTSYLHSLDYLSKMPSRFSASETDEIIYLLRNCWIINEIQKLKFNQKA